MDLTRHKSQDLPRRNGDSTRDAKPTKSEQQSPLTPAEAEKILGDLASVFLTAPLSGGASSSDRVRTANDGDAVSPKPEDMYRVLVEQIPAVVFIAYLDRGISESYVSPQIEAALGFSQEEWIEDPIRWYQQIHPDDKQRWSVDAARMFLTGEPLKAAYRVIARDGRVVWFHCEARMVRKEDGRPWFLHGVGFDISELKQAEQWLHERTLTLQNLSARLLQMQDQEHRRIARELHDSLGQYLAALNMNLDQLSRSVPGAIKPMCTQMRELVDRCIHETRTLSYLLHPPLLDEIGFKAAAQWYVEGFAARSGVKVALNIPPNLDRLPDVVELTLFRVLQEALTNIHRHSGSTTAEISLTIQDRIVSLQIRDHGHGLRPGLLDRFEKTGSGMGVGVSGMRERASELGGRLEISSSAEGTVVALHVPVS